MYMTTIVVAIIVLSIILCLLLFTANEIFKAILEDLPGLDILIIMLFLATLSFALVLCYLLDFLK